MSSDAGEVRRFPAPEGTLRYRTSEPIAQEDPERMSSHALAMLPALLHRYIRLNISWQKTAPRRNFAFDAEVQARAARHFRPIFRQARGRSTATRKGAPIVRLAHR
jgi:hypothetical protein